MADNSTKDLRARGKMSDLATELEPHGFYRIHKSYLVNLMHIDELHTSTLLINGIELPIGRVYKANLMHTYMSYLAGQ